SAPSSTRIIAPSTAPPTYPATRPYVVPMVMAKSTDSDATASEMRAPLNTRDSTSRLYWSVPNQCDQEGGVFLSRTMSSCSAPPYEMSHGPTIAATTSTAIVASAQRAERWVRRRRRPGLLCTESRVDRRVQQVGEQIADHDEHRADDDRRRDDVVVARVDRAHREIADARPGEHLLDEHRAAEQRGEKKAEQHDHRRERRAERMAPDDAALGNAFGARGAHVVGRQRVEHRAALIAGDRGRGEQRERRRREHEVRDPVEQRTARRQVIVHHRIDRAARRQQPPPV